MPNPTAQTGEVPQPMPTQEFPRRPLHGLAAAAVTAAMMLIPAGAAMAAHAGTADVASPAASADELRTMVDDLSVANQELTESNVALQQQLDELQRERDDLRDSIDRFDDLYGPLEADRQLLLQLRKDLPETRPEAEAQLERIRSLALASDPARLGRLVDRLDEAAPAFLDWRFGQFETPQEFNAAYVDTGANAFDSSMTDFRSEVLMSVANRLDGLLNILQRVR
jgi:hypothetical protein